MEKIGIIIVLYNSEQRNYLDLVGYPNMQLVLVDNTPDRDLALFGGNISYIPFKENRGIATAQNAGIRKAEELGCTHILFFDQDSTLSVSLVNSLLSAHLIIKAFDPRVAIVGPLIINKSTGSPYKMGADLTRRYCEARELISSGSIVSIDIFQKVGNMMESLFIDMVDFEWCWRAESLGFRCYVATEIRMEHMVGTGVRQIGTGLNILLPTPMRYYYLYRNWLILMRIPYVPLGWKIKQSVRRVFELLIVPFVRKGYTRMIVRNMSRGIIAGIRYSL